MRLNPLNMLSGLGLLMSVTVAQAGLPFSLTPATLPGIGTNEILFTGTLNSTSPNTNFLNNIQIVFTNAATNYFTADTNVFFANVPGILLPDESYSDVVFGVAVNSATPPGTYSGTVTIQGGADIFVASNLTNRVFQISVPAAALKVAPSGTNLVVLWPSPPGGFVLQQNSDLTTTNWTAVTNTPATTNFQNQVILRTSNSNRFYRLKYP